MSDTLQQLTTDNNHNQPYIPLPEALQYLEAHGLKVSEQWLRRYKGKNIPSTKICKRLYYKISDLDEFLGKKKEEEKKPKAKPAPKKVKEYTPPEPVEAKDEKKNLVEYPSIRLTKLELSKVATAYEEKGLDFHKGLAKLQEYAENNSRKFGKYTSHFRCLIGWVLEAVLDAEAKELRLQREREYLAKARGGAN